MTSTSATVLRRQGPPLIAILLTVSVVGCAVFIDRFASADNLANIARQGAVLALLAIGQTFVIAAGMIDLTVGALATLVVVTAAQTIDGESANLPIALLMAFGIGLGVGALTGILDATLKIHSLILTFGLMSVLGGVVFTYTDQSSGAPAPPLVWFANGLLGGVPVALVMVLVLTAVFQVVMARTPFGVHVQAVGSSLTGARHAGIPVARVKILCFVISGGFAALAGLLLLGRLGTGYPNAGDGMELDAIIAVVLGGTSLAGGRATIVGSVAAAALLAVLSNALNLLEISSFIQMTVKGLIVVAVIIANRPRRWGRSQALA
jgi:ribose/xylose/arabinose/galactoside ABC-type transport system permease subunit